MTRNELINLLTARWDTDEEVCFLFDDDQGAVRARKVTVEEHTETRDLKYHFEVKHGDKLLKFANYTEARDFLNKQNYSNDEASMMARYVADETVTDTVKVLHITE